MALSPSSSIPDEEKRHIRDLAHQYAEYAALPVMKERKKLWYAHNSLEADRPPIVMEIDTFLDDLLPAPRCMHPIAAEMEEYLQKGISNHELVNDDKVLSFSYDVPLSISTDTWGVDIALEYSSDDQGRRIGFAYDHPITDLSDGLDRLKPSRFSVDQEETDLRVRIARELLEGILPVRIVNRSLDWYLAPSMQMVELMGMEQMMFGMMDNPEKIHELYAFLTADIKAFLRWQEQEGLLILNNADDYAGAGSYGFTRELPGVNDRNAGSSNAETGRVSTRSLWGNMNSQETVGISPQMYREFIFPYYRELAEEFGLVYYGCCEPVHDIWEESISRLPNLRKVSISAWCNEEMMGERLQDSPVIYSRKPSPNYIGVGVLDEEAFSDHIATTLRCARGCSVEILFRDIYALDGDRNKPGRAVSIVRELIERMW